MEASSQRGRSGSLIAGLLLLALGLSVFVAVPGCGGCRNDPKTAKEKAEEEARKKEEKEKKKKKKKEKDFELGPALTMPHAPPVRNPEKRKDSFCWYKPGHWTATSMAGKANKADFIGHLEQQALDSRGRPMHLEAVPFDLVSTRGVSMPKKQPKTFESLLFVPASGKAGRVAFRIKTHQGSRSIFEVSPILRRMPSYQYHFVVLSDLPERYSYLSKLDSVNPPWESMLGGSETRNRHYLVELLPVQAGRRPAIPSHALFWTSTAYVLWDDADPEALTLDQQVALLDWLHWGGQLILSGPKTIESLGSSFLKDYLPVTIPTDAPASRQLAKEDFEEINEGFSLPVRGIPGPRIEPVRPWEATRVKLHPAARYVHGTGELLVERRIGRGRVVASVFRLTGRELTGWDGFDGFFNACVLGRPPRRYSIGNEAQLQLNWANARRQRLDARLVCGLRYFSRDTGVAFQQYAADVVAANAEEAAYDGFADPSGAAVPGAGVAAWNDFNATAKAARDSLGSSARIEIPDRMFVVWVVAVYLLVLVPGNWLVFRSLGRVEWAWAAAPVIALLCTATVIKLAQLDIGFARSVTEIAVLEIQGDYPRGHMTRYTALYTSLSTGYDLSMEDAGGQIQPFSQVSNPGSFRLQLGEGYNQWEYRHGNDVAVPDYRVRSNSTRLIHSEQMVDIEGPLTLRGSSENGYTLTNRTGLALRGAGVVRRAPGGRLQTAWLGTLEPDAEVPVRFGWEPSGAETAALWRDRRDESPVTAANAALGQLTIRALIDLAQDTGELKAHQVRLIAWVDREIPGLRINPVAPQAQRATLVVANLRFGFEREPRPDANCRADADRPARRETAP